MDLYPVQGESITLIRLTLKRLEISTGSNERLDSEKDLASLLVMPATNVALKPILVASR